MLIILLIIVFGTLAITKVIELEEKRNARKSSNKNYSRIARKKWKYYSRTNVN